MKFSCNKSITIGVAIAGIVSLAACGSTDADDGGVIELRLAHYMPPTHTSATDGVEVWMHEVEKRTNGKVKFDYFPSGQLISAEQMVSSIGSDTVDIGVFVAASAAPAEMPLSEIPQVPGFESSNLRVVDAAYQELLRGPLSQEWEASGIHPIMSQVNGGYEFLVQGEPRQTLADWRGKTVRTAGGVFDFAVKGLGASAVNIPGPEQYEAMQRGTVDSSINSIESVPTYDFDEVSDAVTLNAPLGAVAQAMGINQNTYADLPEDVRSAMDEATEVAMKSHQDALESDREDAINSTKDHLNFYELSRESLDELQPVLEKAQKDWLSQREGGAELLPVWEKALAKAESEYGD